MSSPLLFIVFVIVIDLVLKSVKDKKRIEEEKHKREEGLQGKPNVNMEKPIQKPEPTRGIMPTFREEVEKERQRELQKQQGRMKQSQEAKLIVEDKQISRKDYETNEYRERKEDYNKRKEIVVESKIKSNERDIKEDIIRGIIFSEILSEPKSIQNQRRSM